MKIIEEYQPDLWVYGHTHQPRDEKIGNTRIISNPRGYPRWKDSGDVPDFDPYGKPVEVK